MISSRRVNGIVHPKPGTKRLILLLSNSTLCALSPAAHPPVGVMLRDKV